MELCWRALVFNPHDRCRKIEKSGAENMEGKCFFLEFILMLSYGALLLRSAQRTVSWGIL
jgi:hypothetical protein